MSRPRAIYHGIAISPGAKLGFPFGGDAESQIRCSRPDSMRALMLCELDTLIWASEESAPGKAHEAATIALCSHARSMKDGVFFLDRGGCATVLPQQVFHQGARLCLAVF
ncbi:hypothetical protein ZIOFF_051812 [Zingiber officinale]|uniref:Uncharacterized protein n=1 Tax=Zingiber officinale TaxID=94328 RepID=A0A8J5FMM8_ZINOF|nr:hypothetical protein ZIOFF_051812 [Zingiber officinale]